MPDRALQAFPAPSSACMFGLEGVIARESREFIKSQPNYIGLKIFHSLKVVYQPLLCTYERDKDKVVHWLRLNGIRDIDYAVLLGPKDTDVNLSRDALRLVQMGRFRQRGYSIALAIDSDPTVCQHMFMQGVPALLFSHPQYSRGEFRPDAPKDIRTFDDLERDVSNEVDIRNADPRFRFAEEDDEED